MGFQSEPIQLNVLIVGAGIGGLTAATALKHAGHKIFDCSQLLREVGAAIMLSPNGTRVLSRLGFDFDAAKGVRLNSAMGYSGATLEDRGVYLPGAYDNAEERIGFPFRTFHRVDLHTALRNLALKSDGSGPDIGLHLGARIMKFDVEAAEIEMKDGTKWKSDLLIGADGLHSIVKKEVLGKTGQEQEIEDGRYDIYRWLLDTKVAENDPVIATLMRKGCLTNYAIPSQTKVSRLVWYSCRNGEVQNLAAFCRGKKGQTDQEAYDGMADKQELLDLMSDYHPTLQQLVRKAETIKTWRIRNRVPLDTYFHGKTLLIGDAAHPMLPFNAQAGNQALEDGGAVLALFSNLESRDDITERLRFFDVVRRKRANRIQIISSVPAEEVKFLGDKLKGYEDEAPRETDPEGLRRRLIRDLGYNVFEGCEKALAEASKSLQHI